MNNKVGAPRTRLRLLVFSVSLLFVVCVSLVGTNISAQAGFMTEGAAQKKAAPVTQAPPAEKTVEQTQKNIQVLNGLPASQLGPLMNYIGSSLGVKCTYCHVNKDDNWDFPSDEKPEKSQAREMIKMVQAINKANFKGNPAVGCYTCHRGKAEPIRVPQLPLAEPTPFADSPATTTTPKDANPTAEQILTRYTEALGGAAAIEKLKTRSMKGSWLTSTGITLGYEVYQTAPERIYTILNTPRQGTIERGFDGHVGWEKSQRGLRDLEDREVFLLMRYPDLFKDIKLQGQFTRISFSRRDTIDGNEVYLLSGLGIDGKGERLYFDTKTGLLLRRITSMRTMVGLIPEQIDFADYRDVGGLKLPFTIRITSIDSFYSSTRTFTEIKLNVPVDETKFTKPPAPATSPNP
jgi:hypothetical protein